MKHTHVLAYVNRIRKKLGKKPIKRLPKGDKKQPDSCPIRNGLGFGSVGDLFITGLGMELKTPRYVAKFIHDFDSGKHPELVRK